LRGVLIGVLKNHPDGALTQFRGIFAGSCHWVHPLSELTLRQTRAASLVISAGPLSIHSPGVAIAGVPILWTAFGAAIEWMPRNAGNWLRAALLLYYGSAVWALVHRSESVFVTRAPAALWIVCTLWAVLYLSGQVVVWKHLNRAE
ncbi:MAG TPA: hypothetical protein VGD94_18935, partial [Vicinamibacterales bacterium]